MKDLEVLTPPPTRLQKDLERAQKELQELFTCVACSSISEPGQLTYEGSELRRYLRCFEEKAIGTGSIASRTRPRGLPPPPTTRPSNC
jgi:hypothetical protein